MTSKLLEKTTNSLPQFIASLNSVVCLLALSFIPKFVQVRLDFYIITWSFPTKILNYFTKKLRIEKEIRKNGYRLDFTDFLHQEISG